MTPELGLASRMRRLLATAIDMLLVPALTVLLVGLLGVVEHAEDFTDSWWVLHVLLLAIASYLILNGPLLWRRGQTVGKWALGIAMHTKAHQPVSFWKLVFIRAWFFPLLFLPALSFVGAWPLSLIPIFDLLFIFGQKRRCLHDRLSGTQVVRLNKSNSAA